MTPKASKECWRTDHIEIPVLGPLLPEAEGQKTAFTGVPATARLSHQPSPLPARPSVARYLSKPSHLSPLSPLEPALHMCGSPVERCPCPGSLKNGHGPIGDCSMDLPALARNGVSENQSARRETVTDRSKDPEKGFLEDRARQYNANTTAQLPASKIKYIYNDVSEGISDAEEHTVWVVVKLRSPKSINVMANPLPRNRSTSPSFHHLSASSSPSIPSSSPPQCSSSPSFASVASPTPCLQPNSSASFPRP
jgi:hypothetical protein